jgi:antimicrobial peptide system SdpA family protein
MIYYTIGILGTIKTYIMNYKNKLFIPFGILVLAWGFVINLLVVSFAPYNPLTPSVSARLNISLLAPQGWAFFTRNAREPNTFIYAKNNNNKFAVIDNQKNTSRSNLFGISRDARSLSAEVVEILKQVDTSKWSAPSTNDWEDQFKKTNCVSVINKSLHPILKDTVFIEYKEKVPWAWVKADDQVKMPSKTIKLYVTIPKTNK